VHAFPARRSSDLRDGVNDTGQPLVVQASLGGGQRRRPDLDHDPFGCGDRLPRHRDVFVHHSSSSSSDPAYPPCSSSDDRRACLAAFRSAADTRSLPSSRESCPRLPSTPATPAGVDGSQSKVMSPIVTWLPGFAPTLASSSSTPSFASRSAR